MKCEVGEVGEVEEEVKGEEDGEEDGEEEEEGEEEWLVDEEICREIEEKRKKRKSNT